MSSTYIYNLFKNKLEANWLKLRTIEAPLSFQLAESLMWLVSYADHGVSQSQYRYTKVTVQEWYSN